MQLAGYSPPTISGVGTVNLQGTYKDSSGNPLANETITLMQTTNNSTFPSGLTAVAQTTTDINGFYSFSVTPSASGTYYYYLMDNSTGTPVYTYLQTANVSASSTISNTTLELIAVVVVVIVVIIAAVVFLMRRNHKSKEKKT